MSNEPQDWVLPVPGLAEEQTIGKVQACFDRAAQDFEARFGKIEALIIPPALRFVARSASADNPRFPRWIIIHQRIEPYEQNLRDSFKIGKLHLAANCFAFVTEDGTLRVQSTEEAFR